MLKSLAVTNFALIEAIRLDFHRGLNIITGETGAGKSLLIDALNAVLGGRVSHDVIRSGQDWLRVEAVFAGEDCRALQDRLENEWGLEAGDELIIHRRVNRHGKNQCFVNNSQVTLGTLRQLGQALVDIHGQHENQALLRPETYLNLLDAYGGDDIEPSRLAYEEVYRQWTACRAALAAVRDDAAAARQMDMLQWQVAEIDAAGLRAGEEEELEERRRFLGNAEKITQAVAAAHTLLRSGDGRPGALDLLAEAVEQLAYVKKFDQTMAHTWDAAQSALYQLEDAASDIAGYYENLEFDPHKLAAVEERLDTIYKLKKKYGATIADILTYRDRAQAELAELKGQAQRREALTRQLTELTAALGQAAAALTDKRRQCGESLGRAVERQLADLGMRHARFTVAVADTGSFTSTGTNSVDMLFSANPGEAPRPLAKVASGGELSRLALAIKTVIARHDAVGTLVFDEVDAGVGGQAAQMVAEKIAAIAQQRQVLCITHLPQIACMADWHYCVEKTATAGHTNLRIVALDRQGRVGEIARMINGLDVTPAARENARLMLEKGQKKRHQYGQQ